MSQKQRLVYETLLDWYEARRYSQRHSPVSVAADRNIVLDFLTHAKGIPGQVQPEDFEAWSQHLFVDRELAAGSQRKYQSVVRTMFTYLCATPRCRNLVRSEFDCDIVQVVTPDAAIPHRRPNESGRRGRRPMTKEEQHIFFKTLDVEITYASHARSKSLAPLQRDKAMFHVTLRLGLRADECVGLDITSFASDSRFAQHGEYAMCRVFGKGAKWRTVPIDDPVVPEVLRWYFELVRPQYELKANAIAAKAFFLSERGRRLSYSAFYNRFKYICYLANLPDDLVPHSLRHSSVTDGAMEGMSLHANQFKHGHEHASTTQTYIGLPDDFITNEFSRVLEKRTKQRLH
jgi:site-specific recombinase XerD